MLSDLALAAALATGSLKIDADGGFRSEILVSRTEGRAARPEWVVRPFAMVELGDPSSAASLTYSPRVSVPLLARDETDLLHGASLAWRRQVSERLLVRAGGALERGEVHLSPLSDATGSEAVPSETPIVGRADLLRGHASAGFADRLEERTAVNGAVGYRVGGDLAAGPGASYPLQHGPELAVALERSLTRLDRLDVRANGNAAFIGADRHVVQGHVASEWHRSITRQVSTSAGAGVGIQSVGGGDALGRPRYFPVGTAALAYGSPDGPVRARLAFALLPYIDPFSGAAYLRGTASVSGDWAPRPGVGLSVSAFAGAPTGRAALSEEGAAYAEGRAWVDVARGAALSTGLRWAGRRRPLGEDRPANAWSAFVGFSYVLRGQR